ncbi:GNVR domain-containing protein [Sphingomonas sp. I4]
MVNNNVASIALGGLQLRSDTAHQSYAQLLTRLNEIGTQGATTQSDARVASFAAVPTRPSAPNRPINLLVGALLATAIGLGVVFLRQGTDHGISTLEDVEGRLQLPISPVFRRWARRCAISAAATRSVRWSTIADRPMPRAIATLPHRYCNPPPAARCGRSR